MHTVFRFQKGESAAKSGGSQEASPRSSARASGALTADPLSTGAEVGRPEPPVRSVNGNEVISVVEVNRGSELETGQVRHGSPGKIAAASVKSESNMPQSASLSGRVETESFREVRQSNIPEGSERSVSGNGETSQSRPSGRGASPSETLPPGESTRVPDREGADAPTPAAPHSDGGRGPARTPPPPEEDGRGGLGESTRVPPGLRATTAVAQARFAAHPAAPNVPSPTRKRPAAERSVEPSQPGLVIGRIDVVVVADGPAPSKGGTSGPTGSAFLNRNYLKRL